MQMAAGYPIEAQLANSMEKDKELIKQWPYSKKTFLIHAGEKERHLRLEKSLYRKTF